MAEPPDSRTLTPADLLDMIVQLRAEVAGLRAENAALKDEIRRLKGLPPRPIFASADFCLFASFLLHRPVQHCRTNNVGAVPLRITGLLPRKRCENHLRRDGGAG
jgi:hypothetical protein